MPTPTPVRTEREQVEENALRRARFGENTRNGDRDEKRWDGVTRP